MPKGFTEQDAALLDELGVEVEPEKVSRHTAREERLIAGFEAIQRFVDTYGRAPGRGEDRDIFERLFAVRLDRILEQDECRTLLTPLDRQGLLSGGAGVAKPLPDAMDDDALLAELGVEAMAPGITELHHVRSSAEKRAAEEVATRRACDDFETFRPLFDQLQRELDAGIRETRPFERKSEIAPGRFFIVGGQKAYVAEMGEVFTQEYGDRDARLHVIFDNGTENNMLRRSLQRALHKDEAGRRITEATAGPLFADQAADGDETSGTIYVLRSKSDLPLTINSEMSCPQEWYHLGPGADRHGFDARPLGQGPGSRPPLRRLKATAQRHVGPEGRLVYTSADQAGQNGNPGWNVLTGGSHVVQEPAPSRTQMSTTHAWRFLRLRARVSLVIPW